MRFDTSDWTACRTAVTAAGLCLAALALGACGRNAPPVEVAEPTSQDLQKGRPVDIYTRVGGRIKTCWFNPLDPMLKEHVFRAEAAPGGRTQIGIYEIAPGGRLGQKAFQVNFTAAQNQTGVVSQNIRMPSQLAAQMASDVRRFAAGDANCSNNVASFDDPPQGQGGPRRRGLSMDPLGGASEQ
jgi:hypothetical protein